jgi:ribosomal-protein-alanine N-acetyltransferase
MRALKPEDGGWLAEIHAQSFDAARRWSPALISSFLQTPASYGRAFVSGEQPAGFILAQFAGEEGEIVTLATLPAQRRQGIAAKLVEEFINEGSALKKQRLFLEVAETNAPAIALYRKLGFEKTGVRAKYYAEVGGGVDAWIMQKSLSNS